MPHALPVPGIEVAIYTEAPVLPPAANSDFVVYICELLSAGRRDYALLLGESVVEILHHPARGGQQLLGYPLQVAPVWTARWENFCLSWRCRPWRRAPTRDTIIRAWWRYVCTGCPASLSRSLSFTAGSCCKAIEIGLSPGRCPILAAPQFVSVRAMWSWLGAHVSDTPLPPYSEGCCVLRMSG